MYLVTIHFIQWEQHTRDLEYKQEVQNVGGKKHIVMNSATKNLLQGYEGMVESSCRRNNTTRERGKGWAMVGWDDVANR